MCFRASWDFWAALGRLRGPPIFILGLYKAPKRAPGRSRDALGALLNALGRSWALLTALGTLLAPFRDLQGLILASPRSPQGWFKRILNNLSARTRTFQKSAESCPRTVREDSENQIQQRCTASSLQDLYRQDDGGRRSSRSELNPPAPRLRAAKFWTKTA